MPEANLETFNFEGLAPDQLEQMRRDIVAKYGPGGVDKVDDMSVDDLRKLAALTAALRRRTTPTAKKSTKATRAKKVSTDDLLSSL